MRYCHRRRSSVTSLCRVFSASSADGYTTSPTYFNWVGTKNIAWTTKLVSRHGSPVYLQVQGVRNNFFDTDWRRMTPNSYSTTGTTMSGRFDGSTGSLGWDGVRFKLCRDISNSPDSCGPATATFPR